MSDTKEKEHKNTEIVRREEHVDRERGKKKEEKERR